MDFLELRKYRVAPVTVDYADYSFAGAYTRELRRGNVETADKIRQAYLDQVDVGFAYAERASTEIFGREIAQILLIHCNELNAVSLRDSIARMRKRGYTFITLDEAMKDRGLRPARHVCGIRWIVDQPHGDGGRKGTDAGDPCDATGRPGLDNRAAVG